MQFVDKQYDIACRDNLVNGVFNPFFKIAAILCTRNHASQIKRDKAFIAQLCRHIAFNNPSRDPFGDRSLSDAWFSDQAGIIFCTAR